MTTIKPAPGITATMREGDIVLVCEKGIKHAIDRILQSSKWHHVMLYIGSGKVLEVTPLRGCRISEIQQKLIRYHAYKILRHNAVTKAKGSKIVSNAVSAFNGKKFSWLQILRILIFRRLKIWHSCCMMGVAYAGYECNVNSVICSNMVSIAYQISGMTAISKYRPEYVVPKDYDSAPELTVIAEVNTDRTGTFPK